MHVIEMKWLLERELRDAVLRHHPLDWKEDAITHDLMIRIRNYFKQVTLEGAGYPLNLEWQIYKLHGIRETTHGDVGILVRHRTAAGTEIEGAGFLEAKARARDSNRFPQVRVEQLNRLMRRSPQTRLLLYDYNAVPVLDSLPDSDLQGHGFGEPFLRNRIWRSAVTHGPIVPLQLATAIGQFDDGLYRFSHAFSYQFVDRYFHLHDLDFRPHVVDAVKGFPRSLSVTPGAAFVMVIRTAVVGQQLPEEFLPNPDAYGSVGNEGQR